MPEDDPYGHRHVQGMLGPVLRDFYASVTGVYHFLRDAPHFISENQCRFFIFSGMKVSQADGPLGLFNGQDRIALFL
jgi:hypothetical protein